MNTGRAVLGLGFIGLGSLLLLDRADVLDAGTVIAGWWPVLFLVAALLELLARPPRVIGATVFALLGLLLLAGTTGAVGGSVLGLVWPLAVIGLGLWLVLRRGPVPQGATDLDAVNTTVLFSGRRIVSTSRDFRGGSATAVFGGIELDLTGARITEAADIEVVAVFGSVELTVPTGWRVVLDGPAIFGGHENKASAPAAPDAPVLRVHATAIFGGVDVAVGAAWPVPADA